MLPTIITHLITKLDSNIIEDEKRVNERTNIKDRLVVCLII